MNILNLGSMNVDYVYRVDKFLLPGETKRARGRSVFCGGKGLNQSIAAARAGNTVYHAGLLGSGGEMLRDRLAENGVRLDYLRPYPGSTGHTIIQVDDSGQNCILLYGGSNRALTREFIDGVLEDFGGGTMLLLQNEVNLTGYIIDKAYSMGIPIAMNAAPMDEDVKKYPLRKLSWLIVNELEGRALGECERDEEIIDALASKYPGCSLLLTLGERGSVCRAGGRTFRAGAYRVKAVDTTAAGDTFTGYFLYGVLNGRSIKESLTLATAAAAICVQRRGASDSVPFRAEVDEALAGNIFGRLEVDSTGAD